MRRRAFRPALAFDVLTPLYDRANDIFGFGSPFARRVADAVALEEAEVLLDVGCGTGTLLAELSRRRPHARVTGLDADPQILARAREKLTSSGLRATLIRAYAQDLPIADATFDVVTSTLIFHHLSTAAKRSALAEIYRVLKPRGRFLLADFGRPQTILQWTLLSIGRLFDGIENTGANLQGRLPAMLADAGFQVAEATGRYRAVQFLRGVR
ncbi:MAG TPA: class I SAM-dependent methyltransferase [bacterium]